MGKLKNGWGDMRCRILFRIGRRQIHLEKALVFGSDAMPEWYPWCEPSAAGWISLPADATSLYENCTESHPAERIDWTDWERI